MTELIQTTRVAIIGGGIMGAAAQYQLAENGWTDSILFEKAELTSGSTWHAAGLCSNFIGNMTVAQIHNYTIKLYNEILPQETGEKQYWPQLQWPHFRSPRPGY